MNNRIKTRCIFKENRELWFLLCFINVEKKYDFQNLVNMWVFTIESKWKKIHIDSSCNKMFTNFYECDVLNKFYTCISRWLLLLTRKSHANFWLQICHNPYSSAGHSLRFLHGVCLSSFRTNIWIIFNVQASNAQKSMCCFFHDKT